MEIYWNHNAAYHDRIVPLARGRDVLDVGCGEGLLLQRLARVARHVTGIDPDPVALAHAGRRTSGAGNVTLVEGEFRPLGTFDLVTMVASLHHMDLAAGLRAARDALRPGGELYVVGLAANKTVRDWVIAGVQVPAMVVLDRLYRLAQPPVPIRCTEPRENLREIRSVAATTLPGAEVRRGPYYRYTLRWRRAS